MPVSQLQTAQNIIAHGEITTQNLVSAGIATPGSAVELDCEGVGAIRIQTTGTYTGALTPQGTLDGKTWVTLSYLGALYRADGSAGITIGSAVNNIFLVNVAGLTRFRITALAAVTGAAVVTMIGCVQNNIGVLPVQGSVFDSGTLVSGVLPVSGIVRTAAAAPMSNSTVANLPITSGRQVIEKPYGPGETDWQFAVATGGITNTTTAVTIKAAAGANIRNYCTGLTLMAQALGAATEVAIRDGAGGTVLWRSYIGTAGLPTTSIVFPTPLRGTANTLMEFVTLTASVTGAVFISAQGYAGA